jgi:hypothetical protein
MPKIDYTRSEVRSRLNQWALIRDCIAGQETIKGKTTDYLPMPNADDTSAQNKARYRNYLLRAMFMNAVGGTLEGLVGQVFSTDPVVDLPDSMKGLIEDADGGGVDLTQSSKRSMMETLALGRHGILVDFPTAPVDDKGAPRAFSRAELQEGSARPTILSFAPDKVINWRTRMIGSRKVLSLVVIEMNYISADDGFELSEDQEWRVLRLDAANLYVSEVWRRTSDATMKARGDLFVLHTTSYPTDHAGQRLGYIPFTFVGSLNNNDASDKPPMYDMAVINIGHYRNSADYEDSVFMVGQPTPVATGLTKDWVDNVLDKKVKLGSRAMVLLPKDADLKLVSAEANGMVKEAMECKERQLVALGAQLVEQKEVQRTLGEAKMEKAVVTSVLVQCAKNTSAAYQQALRWAAAFYGENPDTIFFSLSTDFAIVRMSPEERKCLLAEWQAGIVSFTEAREGFRQSGIAYLNDKDAKSEIDLEMEQRVNMAREESGLNDEDTGGGTETGE